MNKPSVLVDLDGVLAKYDGWRGVENIGAPIPGAVEFTRQLSEFARVVIYTTRCKEYPGSTSAPAGAAGSDRRPVVELVAIVTTWLDRHGFHYDEIYSGQGKPFGVAVIDDRAVSCLPQEDVRAFGWALVRTRALCTGLRKANT